MSDHLGPLQRALDQTGDEARGYSFGEEVPVDSDAPLYDRLAGLFGRDLADP